MESLGQLGVSPRTELVEDVVVPLCLALAHHPRPLQEVVRDVAANHAARSVEMYLDKLAEARGVVVPGGLGVAEGLQDGVGLQDLLLQGALALAGLAVVITEVFQDVLRRLGLSGAGLARYDDALAGAENLHVPEGLVRDGEDVGGPGAEGAAEVGLDGVPAVQGGQVEVGVDGDEDVGDVGVDLVLAVAQPDVVEEGGLVEVHEGTVVLHLLPVVLLGRVNLMATIE